MLQLPLQIVTSHCNWQQGIHRFVAKIGDANDASQRLFKGLGFVELNRSTVFHEITFELCVVNNTEMCNRGLAGKIASC